MKLISLSCKVQSTVLWGLGSMQSFRDSGWWRPCHHQHELSSNPGSSQLVADREKQSRRDTTVDLELTHLTSAHSIGKNEFQASPKCEQSGKCIPGSHFPGAPPQEEGSGGCPSILCERHSSIASSTVIQMLLFTIWIFSPLTPLDPGRS